MTSLPSQLYHFDHYQHEGNGKFLGTVTNSDDVSSIVSATRELGVIEKLCSTYGFVHCCHRDARYFFHFSEYKGDIQNAKIGDSVEFDTSIDKRKQKPVAVNITAVSAEMVGDERVDGIIAAVAREQHSNGYQPVDFIPDGQVTYVEKGETYFLRYGVADLQKPGILVKVGDRVTFNVAHNRRSQQFFARNIALIEKHLPTVKRFRGVISTMKDSFGFIEREDVLKELFFHITEFGPNVTGSSVQPGVEVEFDIQNRHNKEVATNIVILPKGSVVFDEIDATPYTGRILQVVPIQTKSSDNLLTGRLVFSTLDKKMLELPFGEQDRCGLFTLLENDTVQFHIAKDRRDGMVRATQIVLLDQSFLKSNEHREKGMVIKLDETIGGQIQCLSSDQIIPFQFNEIMKDNFRISQGDLLEFSLTLRPNNGSIPHAIRIKLLSPDHLLAMINSHGHELRLTGVIEQDAPANDDHAISDNKCQQIKGDDSKSKHGQRHRDLGVIRYERDGMPSTIPYSSINVSSGSALYCGDKVEFSMTVDGKVTSNVILIERHRMRGWIAILRDGKGFIETSGNAADVAPVTFTASSFTDLTAAIELGDEIEFSLSKIADCFTAENILKVPSTIHKFYSIVPTVHHGRILSSVGMISNDECELLGRIQKVNEDGVPGECYTYSITGVKKKRVVLLPNDTVTFSVAVGRDQSTRAINIVLKNEVRKGKIDIIKGQFGFIDFACEENKKIFFHISEVDGSFELRAGDEVEFYAQYNIKTGKPCASKLRRVTHLQRPERLITKLKSINFDENTRQKLIIIRQPRNADEKSKGFTSVRTERAPGVIRKTPN